MEKAFRNPLVIGLVFLMLLMAGAALIVQSGYQRIMRESAIKDATIAALSSATPVTIRETEIVYVQPTGEPTIASTPTAVNTPAPATPTTVPAAPEWTEYTGETTLVYARTEDAEPSIVLIAGDHYKVLGNHFYKWVDDLTYLVPVHIQEDSEPRPVVYVPVDVIGITIEGRFEHRRIVLNPALAGYAPERTLQEEGDTCALVRPANGSEGFVPLSQELVDAGMSGNLALCLRDIVEIRSWGMNQLTVDGFPAVLVRVITHRLDAVDKVSMAGTDVVIPSYMLVGADDKPRAGASGEAASGSNPNIVGNFLFLHRGEVKQDDAKGIREPARRLNATVCTVDEAGKPVGQVYAYMRFKEPQGPNKIRGDEKWTNANTGGCADFVDPPWGSRVTVGPYNFELAKGQTVYIKVRPLK